MEITEQYKPMLNNMLSLVAGLAFVYLAMFVTGIGAAVVVPEHVLKPMATFSPTIAISVVELITIGVSVAACFVLYSQLLKFSFQLTNYYLMAAPYIIFLILSMFELGRLGSDSVHFIVQVTVRNLPFAVCLYVLAKTGKFDTGA